MPDTVTSQVLHSGGRDYIGIFTNNSDGTGEAAVQKVDISALTGAPATVKIKRIKYSVSTGGSVLIAFDHTTDDTVAIVTGNGEMDLRNFGGSHDPASAGGTGDIMFTTIGFAAADSYMIVLELGIA